MFEDTFRVSLILNHNIRFCNESESIVFEEIKTHKNPREHIKKVKSNTLTGYKSGLKF